MSLDVVGLDLGDLYGLLQRDTTGVDGELGMSLEIGGTARMPTFRGTRAARRGALRRFPRRPSCRAWLNYAERRLDANLNLWRTGENILEVEAHLPLDLGFTGVEQRRLDGPLQVRAHADSVDLGILEALTPAIRRVQRPAHGGRARSAGPGSSRGSRAASRCATAAWRSRASACASARSPAAPCSRATRCCCAT